MPTPAPTCSTPLADALAAADLSAPQAPRPTTRARLSDQTFDAGVRDGKGRAVATWVAIYEAVHGDTFQWHWAIDAGLAVGDSYFYVHSQALRDGKAYGPGFNTVGIFRTLAEAEACAAEAGPRAVKRNRKKFAPKAVRS
jgi:hypothetical protein